MSNDSIIRKIRKLLAIAGDDGATDAEIKNAMEHARRAMDRHHLTEADLHRSPEDDIRDLERAEKGTVSSFVGRNLYRWEARLAVFVREFVGVPCYEFRDVTKVVKNGRAVLSEDGRVQYGKAVVFYGIAEDAAIAATIFDETRLLIATMARTKWGSVDCAAVPGVDRPSRLPATRYRATGSVAAGPGLRRTMAAGFGSGGGGLWRKGK